MFDRLTIEKESSPAPRQEPEPPTPTPPPAAPEPPRHRSGRLATKGKVSITVVDPFVPLPPGVTTTKTDVSMDEYMKDGLEEAMARIIKRLLEVWSRRMPPVAPVYPLGEGFGF